LKKKTATRDAATIKTAIPVELHETAKMVLMCQRAWSPTEPEATTGISDASPQSRGTIQALCCREGRSLPLRLVND